MLASFNEMDYKIVSKLGKRMSAASWGIRFAASQKNVDIVLSGIQNESTAIDFNKKLI